MIAGVVLAAGQSSRLGRPKQLLPIQGEPLVRRTLRAILASSLDAVLVVVGHEAEAVREAISDLPVHIVFNPDFAQGQSTSIRAGLNALAPETEAAVILLGDQPSIDPGIIDVLIAAWRETKAPIVAPRYFNGIGNPVLFDHVVFQKLTALQGDTGARFIVRAFAQRGKLHAADVPGPSLPDIDTEADYAAFLARRFDANPDPPLAPGSDGSRAPSGRRLGG